MIKTLEVRDDGTTIPCVAFNLEVSPVSRRAGFREREVMLINLNNRRCEYDCMVWEGRTLRVAHEYIIKHWEKLVCGDVIDVEFIMGITKEPKTSELH